MDAIVQFVRNALCTVKNFEILGDTFLYDPKFTAKYLYAFPSPLDQTTPLEIIISITQFYAFASISLSGYKIITRSGVGKLQLINRLVNLRVAKKDDKKKDDKNEATANRLVTKSLLDESDAATRDFFIGMNVLVIGIAFFWLFANSFHVTETDWIGGIYGLIHALTVMEVSLLVFLYYMVKNAAGSIRKSYRMNEFAKKIESLKELRDADIQRLTVEEYSWLVGGWAPFWSTGASESISAEGKMLTKEEEAVASKIGSFSKKIEQDVVDNIRRNAKVSVFEGYREYVYLILNFLAFYGYFAGIVAFYYEEESTQPDYVKAMLLWWTSNYASWFGNAVGDFAWTVEPIVILGSPMVITSMYGKKKEKSA
mmetsp:Transcript_8972/g.15593  ORF Transcript_8972/g.15593 Transcript_8972/m.15593 type:complete len:369 (-) Transcript_8972:324-1430(-)|eukprot:CAMPEP_0183756102 /NCGR_PEP_ID=MMETSP0739-20130205/4767_1 /TAXON_ID=385413 /ORGANISM="Thalassiosira miniscula, Strain CCMP1093" /LENGTH=368 /DNA_ID=CAMNT_0025993189 /DNA_START=6 /DNA_END=1112 /DNA_ORIENTATION=+